MNVGEQMFRDLEADLLTACGACHEIGGSADTPFLGKKEDGEDPYEAITSWPGVVVKDEASSVLITWPRVGQHTGGPTNPELEAKLQDWLAEEAASVADVEGDALVVPPFRPRPGFNSVYLDALGDDYVGMAVTFLADELTGSSLSLTEMQIHPTLNKGISFEHPLFTVYPAGSSEGSPDPVDSFSNVSQDVDPGTAQEFGPGTLVITNWVEGGKLSLAFESVGIIDPFGMGGAGGGGPTGPCDALQSFTDNAAGPLGNSCTSCHGGGNGTATNALDMSALGTDDGLTCGQVLNRVNLGTPAASQLFVTTDPNGNAAHPFKFGGNVTNFNNFVSAVSVWIQEEAP